VDQMTDRDGYEKSEKNKADQPQERHIGFYILVVFILLFIPIAMKFYTSYLNKRVDYLEKVSEEKKYKAEIDKIKTDVDRKKEREEYLKTDKGVEEIARNKLGLTKPDEIPFIVSPGNGAEVKESPRPIQNKQKPEKGKKPKGKNNIKPDGKD
jgi:cell division protein FtsB